MTLTTRDFGTKPGAFWQQTRTAGSLRTVGFRHGPRAPWWPRDAWGRVPRRPPCPLSHRPPSPASTSSTPCNFLFRAFHALPPLMTRKGAVDGRSLRLLAMLIKLESEERPSHPASCSTHPGEKFRNELSPGYKANRPPCRPNSPGSSRWWRPVVEAFGLRTLEVPGFEADNIIAGPCARGRRAAAGMAVVVCSSDKDLMQLCDGKAVDAPTR